MSRRFLFMCEAGHIQLYLPNSLYASAGDGAQCLKALKRSNSHSSLSCRGRWKLKGGRQMAQYNLGIPSFRIHQIRSLLKDTLAGSMSLQVLNAQGALHHDWPTQSVNLGDYGPTTTVQTNLLYQNVDVPDPTPDAPDGGSIAWSFVLVNAGHVDYSVLVGALNNAANAVVGALVSSGNVLAELVAGGIIGAQALVQLLTANCDGPVAALRLSFTAKELAQMTADPANWLNDVNCPGTTSPVGCGSNSNYTVYYSMINTNSLVIVPDLIGKSPQAAKALAQQAGFPFTTVSQYTGYRNQIPVVDDQIPGPGSQVPPASPIEAIVIYPDPHGNPR
jgi:hypothetical protein